MTGTKKNQVSGKNDQVPPLQKKCENLYNLYLLICDYIVYNYLLSRDMSEVYLRFPDSISFQGNNYYIILWHSHSKYNLAAKYSQRCTK